MGEFKLKLILQEQVILFQILRFEYMDQDGNQKLTLHDFMLKFRTPEEKDPPSDELKGDSIYQAIKHVMRS